MGHDTYQKCPYFTIHERVSHLATARFFGTVSRYNLRFFGTSISVIATSSPKIASDWLNACLECVKTRPHSKRIVVGFGIQRARTTTIHPPAATLQLCIGHHCLIYKLAHADYVPDSIRDFLVSRTVTLVGLWCHSDAGRLMASRHRVEINEPLDLRYILRRANGENLVDASMEEIVSTFLGFEGVSSDPAIEASNWENEELTPKQVRHASVDAYVSFALGTGARVFEIETSNSSSMIDQV